MLCKRNNYVNHFMLILSIFDNVMNILLLINKYIYKKLKYFKLLFLILTIPVIILSYYIEDIMLSNMICLYTSIIIAYNVIISVQYEKFLESIENEEILINNIRYTNKNNIITFNSLV
ncbi:hypothetical protein MYSEV_250 [Mythimna separata entomopoxvirus 'L']|uniref:Uncharacterized protein n=1 Tax=Mythimna separata entomopoxvirus 'L' TaxID=1293572 RepID=A0A916KQH5_9POXV|nr:hypothetical protein MYSEV_250 [Mythimna separata entomopoxvirus 'L']CCU56448.1 hypothetical protein MYSEV_250 [Mythimna separata entomopoxvirus 'L']